MENTDKAQAEGVKRWAIVLDGRLYKALPPGKGPAIAAFMNEHLNPPISDAVVHLWFNNPGAKVPQKHREYYLELMADALRDTAEKLKSGMSERAISLKKEYEKAARELRAVKVALEKDQEQRAELEVSHG